MSINEKMTVLADKIRAKLGITEKLNLDDIAESINRIYDKGYSDGYYIGKADGGGNSDTLSNLIDGSIAEIVIPTGTEVIKPYTFYKCTNLIKVTVPNSVTHIGAHAFCGCNSLTNISIPEGIKVISQYSFSDTGLTEIVIPASVTTIESCAFMGSDNIILYDFSKSEAVPTLVDNYSLGTNTNTKILVPSSLYDEWINATNWSNYRNFIVSADVKAIPNEDNFSIYVDADLLHEIVNYNFLGIKLATGVGKSEVLYSGSVPYLRIYGDGTSPEAYAQIQNIEGRKTGKYLVFAYRLPTSNPESHDFFQIYVNTTGDRPTGNGDLINIKTSKDGKWHVIAIDIAEAIANQKKVVSGEYLSQFVPSADGTYTIERLRIDFFNELTSTGSYVDVAYVGTCDSLELARGADADYTGAEIDTALLISRLGTKASLNVHNSLMPYVTITDATNSSGEKYVEIHNSDTVLANTSGYVGILYRAYGLGGSYGQIYIGSSDNTYNYSGSIVYNGDNNWNFGIIEIDRSRYKDSVCRKLRFDYFNGLAANTEYSIDVAFIKFFSTEEEANAYYREYAKKYLT